MPIIQTHFLEFSDVTYLDITGIISHVCNQYYRVQLDITMSGIKVSFPDPIFPLPYSLFCKL